MFAFFITPINILSYASVWFSVVWFTVRSLDCPCANFKDARTMLRTATMIIISKYLFNNSLQVLKLKCIYFHSLHTEIQLQVM